jgi:hypothetical protein
VVVGKQVKAFESETPMGRMAPVEELAGLRCSWTAAPSLCTGVDLIVDGGLVCC